MGWNYSVADYNVYYTRYTSPEKYKTLEPLYLMLQNLGKWVGLGYNAFLAIMSFLFLLIRMVLIKKMSVRQNFVIGLYLLFPFIMDITQIRMFYATTIVLLGIFFLLQNKKSSDSLFVFFVIMATLVHSSCILYLLLLFAKNIKRLGVDEYIKLCIAVCVGLYIMLPTEVLYKGLVAISKCLGFGRKFIETSFATNKAYKITHKFTYMIEILLFFVMMNLILAKTIRQNNVAKKLKELKNYEDFYSLDFFNFCLKSNITLLIILPLAWFSGDIYRVQHGLLTLFYIAISNSKCFRSKIKGNFKVNQLMLFFFIIVFMFLFLIGLPSLRNSVFLPVFFKNELFGKI